MTTASPWPFHLYNSRYLLGFIIFFGLVTCWPRRQEVLLCIIPIIILDGSRATFIRSHAWGGGLIASINLMQPLWAVAVDGQAGPDGGKISPCGPGFTLIQPYSQQQSAGNWRCTGRFQMLPLIAWLAWILRCATVIRFVYRHVITIDLVVLAWARCRSEGLFSLPNFVR